MNAYHPVLEKYARQARKYDRRWNRSFGGALLHACLDAVPWPQARRVLDVGCGTGALEQAVLERRSPAVRLPAQLIGVDASLPMLREAQAKLNGAGLGLVSWSTALAEALPFRTASFDAVVCNNSFHYYRRPAQVLAEFHRVIRPHGCLVLADWCNDYPANKFGHWALRVAHRTGIHRYGLERCYGIEECAELLAVAGFQIEFAQRFEIDWGWGVMVCRARA